MRLGDFLTSIPPATGSAHKEKVEFRLLARSLKDGSQQETKGYACFALASDKEIQEAEIDALKSLQDLRKELELVPGFLLESRQRAEVLLRVLRDFDDPRNRFADTSDELQRHVPRFDIERLKEEYEAWAERWYPKKITKEQRAEMKHEAVGK